MKALVIGKGGREHAIVRALAFSDSIDEVHCIPGNDGMQSMCLCHAVETTDFEKVLDIVKRNNIALVVIGPEAEIVAGLSDFLREQDLLVFGPSQKAAQLEASKIFSKSFMKEAGVPTARAFVVNSVSSCLEKANEFKPPYVLKADGLAAGKGVFICQDLDELKRSAALLFEEKILGKSGESALLEEFEAGWEISFLILTNGQDYKSLPLSQDHKRLLDNDEGPNTGGMGAVCPLKVKLDLEEEIHEKILTPTVNELARQNMLYRGVLYVGVMVTESGPKVLEYNVRFGDPEAQVVLPLLDGDWGEVFASIAQGELQDLNWKPLFSTCVVLAAEDYPENPKRGVVIDGDVSFHTSSSYFLHAGTKRESKGEWVTNGGRVLNAVGIGSSLKESVKQAYEQVDKVHWPQQQVRKDIGHRQL